MSYTKILHKSSNEYKILKNQAYNDNKQLFENRKNTQWSKNKLTNNEKIYLYQCNKGCCANVQCGGKLDSEFTVEHIKPKCRHLNEVWDLKNLTILCRSCNSRKKDRHVYEVNNFNYKLHSMVDNKNIKNWINNGTCKKK